MPLSDKRAAELMGRPYIKVLQEHELTIARLYDCLGSTLPQATHFWRQLAKEELQHRNILQVIEDKLEQGGWKFQLPTFKYKDVSDSIEWIKLIRERMSDEGITMNKALEVSLVIENGILESDFFEIVDPSNAEVRKEFNELTKYAEKHFKQIEAEAKKLKWKILGNKEFKFANVLDSWEKCDDPNAKMRAAQSDILELLISLEDAAASLYRTYSRKIPEASDFWEDMARDERQHSAMLKKLHESLEEGHLFEDIGRFKQEDLKAEVQFAKDCEAATIEGDVTCDEALKNALGIERTMAEGDFYTTVTSDADSFQVVAKRLVELTKAHIHELESQFNRLI